MKLTEKQLDEVIDHLFVGQSLPKGFREKFRTYIQERLDKLGCCVLYLTKDPELTRHFKNFMNNFPELDCGRREVIIRGSGTISLIDDYKLAKSASLNSRNQLSFTY